MNEPRQAATRGSEVSSSPGAAGHSGPREHRAIIRPRSAPLSIRWIATVAVAALTAGAVLSVGTVAERNTRRALTREIETRLLLEARNLALSSTEALLAEFPELTLHPLVKEMKASQPELAFVTVVDHANVIQGDPDPRRLGSDFAPHPDLEPVEATLPLAPGETMMTDGRVLVATAPVAHRNGGVIGTARVGLNRDYLEGMIETARRQQTVVLAVVLLVGIAGAFFLMSLLLRPVETLRAGIERIGHGDLDTPLRLRDKTELGVLADAVNDMAAQLKRAQAEMVERERLSHEVELARQIQTSLLPHGKSRVGSFVIEGSQRAAAEVGGDYYDFFKLPDGKMGIAVADVAGKGLAGCLVMSMLSALLRAYRASHPKPASLLCMLDERLGETLQSGSFVTMFYGVLDPGTGELTYASAGHSPLLVYRRASGRVEWHRSKGIPLGAIRGGVIRSTLKDARLTLEPGDLIVQFTDGVNEAFEPSGREQFGFERMEDVVKRNAPQGCADVIAGLHRGVEEWTGDGPALDDETVLVVSREGPSAAAEPTPAADASRAGSGPRLTLVDGHAEPLARLAQARKTGECLRLPASLDALVGIRDWLASRESIPDLGESEFELLVTALYEACANIVEHGYQQNPSESLELWWVPATPTASAREPGAQAESGAARGLQDCYFLIRDRGVQFRADNWKETDFKDPQVWRRGRGFGLDIIHRAMSNVGYHPGTPEGNITLLTFLPTHESDEREELRNA